MIRNFPPDVLVLGDDALVHARVVRGKKGLQVVRGKSYRLPPDAFTSAVVTPELANEMVLAEVLRRVKMENGKLDRVSVLLPDSWFRLNIVELPSLPAKPNEAMEMVRWTLKRTMPLDPQTLRVAYDVLAKTVNGAKVLAVSAVEATLAAIERVFAAAGCEVVLIEPIGLNIWNALVVREQPTTNDRLFLFVRDHDFTTAVFRGTQPLFIRSRNLNAERSVEQEIRLSATYLRDSVGASSFENCYVAGNRVDPGVAQTVAGEFSAPVHIVALRELAEAVPDDIAGIEAELTACTGVFAG